VHWPQYTPGSSAWMVSGWNRPGTASFLPLRVGIQNEWMTSREVMERFTGSPAGMTRSVAVTISSKSPSPSRS
jgi:hypothetical protein